MTLTPANRDADALEKALDSFDWDRVAVICNEVVARLWSGDENNWNDVAGRMLKAIRRKRQFSMLERLAQGFFMAGVREPIVQQMYAQALIDQGRFASAETVLQPMLKTRRQSDTYAEARGLLGRLHKQLYVAAGGAGPSGNPAFLRCAIEHYLEAYEGKPAVNHWHGINVVALATRAARDGVSLPASVPKPGPLAKRLLKDLDALQLQRFTKAAKTHVDPEPTPAFELASRLEALIALDRFADAIEAVSRYVQAPRTDAFELGSTERQLREVWQLDERSEPEAGQVLAIIRAMLLTRQGGKVVFPVDRARQVTAAARETDDDFELQARLGPTGSVPLAWYRAGLDCCAGVVQIQNRHSVAAGTGWLVDGGALAARWKGLTVVVTNKHVVSPGVDGQRYVPAPGRQALLPDESVMHHELTGLRVELRAADVLYSSDDVRIDATVLRVQKRMPGAKPLALSTLAVKMADPPDRVYIIGHPSGRGLEFSLQDNLMLACDERRLHYRAPTEGGSSGSPVFDKDWNVIALHHGGGSSIGKLDDSGGKYGANEGIIIGAVRADVESSRSKPARVGR